MNIDQVPTDAQEQEVQEAKKLTTREALMNFIRHTPLNHPDNRPEETPTTATWVHAIAIVMLLIAAAGSGMFSFWCVCLGLVLHFISMTYWSMCCDPAALKLTARYKDGFGMGAKSTQIKNAKEALERTELKRELAVYKHLYGELPEEYAEADYDEYED